MENPSASSPAVLHKKTAILCHWLVASLLAIVFALEMASFFWPLKWAGWADAVLIILATASTLAAAWRRLPLQNVLLATAGIALIGGGFSALGARTDLPFGPFVFTSGIGLLMFKTLPWAMPLVWVVVVLNARGVARLILRPWRKTKAYGFRLIGVTALLVLLFDLALDPFASHVKHFWLWLPTAWPLTWQGASFVNFLAWALISVLILLLVTPVLIVKKPRQKSGPDFHPLGLWLGAILLFGTGCAVTGLWTPVVADAVVGIGVAVFAIRGAMW
jgi:putative membrane protein